MLAPSCPGLCCALCLQQRQADVALSSKRLAELREEVSRRQGQLDSLESLYAERQESLRQTANELAFRRGELSTLESSLSESLRRKADAEYQALEERLRRCGRVVSVGSQCRICCCHSLAAHLVAYCASKLHESYFSWCFVCSSQAGVTVLLLLCSACKQKQRCRRDDDRFMSTC